MKILAIYDNNNTIDQYTIVLDEKQHNGTYACLCVSYNPYSPLGFCQHSSCDIGNHLGKKINYSDLPSDCQKILKKYEYFCQE